MFQKPGEWLMLRRPKNHTSRAVNDHSSDIKDNWDSDKIMRERKLFLGLMTRARSNAAQSIPWWRWQEAISRTSAFAPNQEDQSGPGPASVPVFAKSIFFLSHILDYQCKRGFIFNQLFLTLSWTTFGGYAIWKWYHDKNDKNDQRPSSLSFFLFFVSFKY